MDPLSEQETRRTFKAEVADVSLRQLPVHVAGTSHDKVHQPLPSLTPGIL
jgi:hypothetical protein